MIWKYVPSRSSFLIVGCVAVGGLILGFVRAHGRGYFTNRVGATLHLLVIADLLIESTIFEVFRLYDGNAVVSQFHDNMNFVGCATAFTLLLASQRWYSQRRTLTDPQLPPTQIADGAAYGQARI